MKKIILTKNKMFIATFISVYLLSFVMLFSGNGLIFYFHPWAFDSFMDLFVMVSSGYHNSTYPPLSLIPFKLFHLMRPDINLGVDLKVELFGAYVLMLFIFSFVALFVYTLFFAIKGDNKRKIAYSMLFLFSGIVLWATERANLMSFAFLFSLLAVLLYQSNDDKKKRIAYILLALAISLKLYPGAFLLLLLQKKDFKGIFIVFLDVAIIFIFSYFACFYLDFLLQKNYQLTTLDSILVLVHIFAVFVILALGAFVVWLIYLQKWQALKKMALASFVIAVIISIYLYFAKNINVIILGKNVFKSVFNALWFANYMTRAVEGVNVSIKNLVLLANFFVTKSRFIAEPIVAQVIKYFVIAGALFAFAMHKRMYKKLLAIVLLCIYVPDFSATYLLMYLLIPILFFINEDYTNNSCKGKYLDYFYAILFALAITFVVIPFNVAVETHYKITAPFLLMVFTTFLLYISVLLEAIVLAIRRINPKRSS